MSVPGVNNTSAIGNYGVPNSLTAEGLLLYCQSQLSDIDGDIKGYIEQQKKAIAEKQILSELKNTLSKYQPPSSAKQKLEIAAAYGEANFKLKELGDTELAAKVEGAFHSVFPSGDMNVAIVWSQSGMMDIGSEKQKAQLDSVFGAWTASKTKEGWAGTVGDVTTMVEDLSGNAEINIIQLQSLMSKRQTAVQLTTNMMAKQDQTAMSPINNIK